MLFFFGAAVVLQYFLLLLFLVYHLLTVLVAGGRAARFERSDVSVCFASGLDKASLLPAGPSRAGYCEFGRWQALAKGTAWAG